MSHYKCYYIFKINLECIHKLAFLQKKISVPYLNLLLSKIFMHIAFRNHHFCQFLSTSARCMNAQISNYLQYVSYISCFYLACMRNISLSLQPVQRQLAAGFDLADHQILFTFSLLSEHAASAFKVTAKKRCMRSTLTFLKASAKKLLKM